MKNIVLNRVLRSFVVTIFTTGSLTSIALAESGGDPGVFLNTEDLLQQGEALIYATGDGPRHVAHGIAMLEEAAAAGNLEAKISLGSVYLYGIVTPKNLPKALKYFEEAALARDGSGIAQYGMMQMWSETDWVGAEKMLERAGNMGVASAWATLAEGAMYGYLGGGSYSRNKFAGFAEKARATGNARIEVLDATRQMWGISMPASGPKAIAKLESAANSGNGEAANYLISLVRDGNGLNVSRNPTKARDYLTQYHSVLGEAEAWQLGLTIDAAKARTVDDFAEIAADFKDHHGQATKSFGEDIYKANPNVAIYLMQANLAEKGLYKGALDGVVGKRTLRAMHQACGALLDPTVCKDSVMRSDVIGPLITGD